MEGVSICQGCGGVIEVLSDPYMYGMLEDGYPCECEDCNCGGCETKHDWGV